MSVYDSALTELLGEPEWTERQNIFQSYDQRFECWIVNIPGKHHGRWSLFDTRPVPRDLSHNVGIYDTFDEVQAAVAERRSVCHRSADGV